MSTPPQPPVFDATSWPRVVVVTGKGGVGKTTVSAALALGFASRGERVVVVETSGAEVLPGLFGTQPGGYKVSALAPRVHTLSITPRAALEDYVVQQIRIRRLYKLVFENRIMEPFIEAVPGLHDALQLGKVMDLDREIRNGRPAWDRIIVDAPATGHGVTMLGSARAMMDMTRAGPMYDGLKQVDDVLSDPRLTGLVVVALPEEMPVSETIDLWNRLGAAQGQVQMCVLNQMHPPPMAGDDWQRSATQLRAIPSAAVAEATDLLSQQMRQQARQTDAYRRLVGHLPVPVQTLPALPRRVETPDDLESLATTLFSGVGQDVTVAP